MDTNNVTKVMIVGDFLIFRNGLKLLLETERYFKVVGEAADLIEAAKAAARVEPDILVIDSAEIDCGDFESFMAELPRPIPVLVLTNPTNGRKHKEYLELGIQGILSKEMSAEALFKAIRQVSIGDLWFQRKLMVETIKQLVKEKKAIPEQLYSYNCAVLTSREREVLKLICQGMKNKSIAESLFITETTVRHHLTSIFEKLKVNSRLELVVHAFNEKLVEVPSASVGSLDRPLKVNII